MRAGRLETGQRRARNLIALGRFTIDGTDYRIADLTDAAKQQLANLQVCDQEIQRLQQQLGIAQTTRAAYANALKAELPNTTTH